MRKIAEDIKFLTIFSARRRYAQDFRQHSKFILRLPTPPSLVQTLFSTLYKSGNYLVQPLKSRTVLVALGIGFVIYRLFLKSRTEPAAKVFPDQETISKYAQAIEGCLNKSTDITLLNQTYAELEKAYPNNSLTAQHIIDQLHLPKHIDETQLTRLYNSAKLSGDPLRKEIALQLMSNQLMPEYAKAIQDCLDDPKNIGILNDFFTSYPPEIAKQIDPTKIIGLMDAARCPSLSVFETLATQISPQSPAKAVVDHMHRHRLTEDYCAALQTYFDRKSDSKQLAELTSKRGQAFPQHPLKPEVVIAKLRKDPLQLPTLEELETLKNKRTDSLTQQIVEKLLKEKQEEKNIQSFVREVTKFMQQPQKGEQTINKLAAQIPPNAKLPSDKPRTHPPCGFRREI